MDWTFLRSFLRNPLSVASPKPSDTALAQAVAKCVDPGRLGKVLELGPGTGAVTRALITRGVPPNQLVLVEQSREFVQLLRTEMPGISVIEGDAFKIAAYADHGPYRAVVSGLPVLTLSAGRAKKFLRDGLQIMSRGSPFIQYSYSALPPIAADEAVSVEHVVRAGNGWPKLHVWVYRANSARFEMRARGGCAVAQRSTVRGYADAQLRNARATSNSELPS
jgi:phosphatidylethanolamine/phosphatidyl-N-methylethanolamine N-methyltransferase